MGERAAGGVGEEATSQELSAVLGACRALPAPRYPLKTGGEGRVAEDGKVMVEMEGGGGFSSAGTFPLSGFGGSALLAKMAGFFSNQRWQRSETATLGYGCAFP